MWCKFVILATKKLPALVAVRGGVKDNNHYFINLFTRLPSKTLLSFKPVLCNRGYFFTFFTKENILPPSFLVLFSSFINIACFFSTFKSFLSKYYITFAMQKNTHTY